jgi:hypothetical protein
MPTRLRLTTRLRNSLKIAVLHRAAFVLTISGWTSEPTIRQLVRIMHGARVMVDVDGLAAWRFGSIPSRGGPDW